MDYFKLYPVVSDRLWAAEMPFHPPASTWARG